MTNAILVDLLFHQLCNIDALKILFHEEERSLVLPFSKTAIFQSKLRCGPITGK